MCHDSIPCDGLYDLYINYINEDNKNKNKTNDDDRLLLKEFQRFRKRLNKNLFPHFRY